MYLKIRHIFACHYCISPYVVTMKPHFSFLFSSFPFLAYGSPIGFYQTKSLQARHEYSYTCLEPEELYIKSKLLQSDVTRYDETGYNVYKNWFWEHEASGEHYSYLYKYPRNLFNLWSKYQDTMTTFAYNAEVPFFTHQTERDLRPS